MLKYIYRLVSAGAKDRDSNETIIDKEMMTLEERMQWRKEMVFRTVREVMNSVEIVAGMYNVNVSPFDDRGHNFNVFINIAPSFAVGRNTKVNGLAGIESMINQRCYRLYGIVVMGVYWRANDTANVFDIMRLRRQARTDDFADTRPMPEVWKVRESSRMAFQPVLEEEHKAFMQAIESGRVPPPISIGDKQYQTDLAPLSSSSAKYI